MEHIQTGSTGKKIKNKHARNRQVRMVFSNRKKAIHLEILAEVKSDDDFQILRKAIKKALHESKRLSGPEISYELYRKPELKNGRFLP